MSAKKGNMKEPRTIRALFSQVGFVAESKLGGVVGDRYARIIKLKRRKKQEFALSANVVVVAVTTNICIVLAIFQCWIGVFILNLSDGEFFVLGVTPCL